MKIFHFLLVTCSLFLAVSVGLNGQEKKIFPGADEKTPSRSQFFSWINNTNEGATEEQTLVNLAFFKWLKDNFGMQLDIYAFDAGAIDGSGYYGSTDSEKFKQQLPNGFNPLYRFARKMDTRLGIWGGPDGFGDTVSEAKKRSEMMVSLCRDFEFALFKFDAVCGQLRPDKIDYFIDMMEKCRTYSPDLILLNHRLRLGRARPHSTTSLLGGAETYIDVHMLNRQTAVHHRAAALSRRVPPKLTRLTEDHGVCLSSCLDFWEDDLILQAFNRNLILAPQIYGNPWLLSDDEFSKLARIYNLHRRYRDILVEGRLLPEDQYGQGAVSRGDDKSRLITLRNLAWNPRSYRLNLDGAIGLKTDGRVTLRQFHPTEKIIGYFDFGSEISVEVLPFRSCLLLATTAAGDDLAIEGIDYEVVSEIEGKPLQIKLLAYPGQQKTIKLIGSTSPFREARLGGKRITGLLSGRSKKISFPGNAYRKSWHRQLGVLEPVPLPEDAESLYEATCFAADNNALELRSLQRSGPTAIPEVQAARNAFFDQPLFTERGIWDRFMFDGNDGTAFYVNRRWGEIRVNRGALRVDFGSRIQLDELVINVGNEHGLQPFKSSEAVRAQVSPDLSHWLPIDLRAGAEMRVKMDPGQPVRYLRLSGCPDRVLEIEGYYQGKKLDRSLWRGSNLFSTFQRFRPLKAWSQTITLDEVPPGSYLAVPINGVHGVEGAYAAVRIDGRAVGAPDRAVSFPSNTWEYRVRPIDRNYTYYIPLKPEVAGKKLDIVVLGNSKEAQDLRIEAWITSYPIPFQERVLVLK